MQHRRINNSDSSVTLVAISSLVIFVRSALMQCVYSMNKFSSEKAEAIGYCYYNSSYAQIYNLTAAREGGK